MRFPFFRIIISVVFLLQFSLSYADNNIEVKGEVYEATVHDPLVGAKVRLLNASDSSLVVSTIAKRSITSGSETTYYPGFEITLPDRDRKYILEISESGYETYYHDIDSSGIGKNQFFLNLGEILLSPMAKRLDDVLVKATKIKFYNKGDTVVYNADAFNLAEGSMLDALIRQLPNVRLTQQGEIFVDGKKVESLLLDGKDFFGADKRIMLDNLAAYMVKNVKVYEKGGLESEIAGRKTGDSQLVMDVNLKREFMIGFVGNMEGGYGTRDRYLARIFAGTFTPMSKFAIYANANNVNAGQAPQVDTDWRPETMPTGTKKTIQGGVKYSLDTKSTKWSFYAGADASRVSENDGTDTRRTNFLQSGDTYESSFARSRSKMVKIGNNYILKFKNLKGYGIQFSPGWGYEHWDRNLDDVAATFNENPDGVSSSAIEDIYSGNHDSLLKRLINRDISASKLKGHAFWANGSLMQTFNPSGSSDQFTLRLFGNYSNRKDDRNERFDINFGEDPAPAETADRHYKNHPDFKSRAGLSTKYTHYLGRRTYFWIIYDFEHGYQRNTSELFRLDMLDRPEEALAGLLPSAMDLTGALDPANSYVSRRTEDMHRVSPRFEHHTDTWGMWCELPVYFYRRNIRYSRGDYHNDMTRNDVMLHLGYFGVSLTKGKNNLRWTGLIRGSLPDMLNMMDVADTTNPLDIVRGNPNLKKTMEFKTEATYWRSFSQNALLSLRFTYQEMFDAIARGYFYDRETGVRTSSFYNVDGNRSFSLSTEANTPIGSLFSLRNTLEGSRIESVDLVGSDSPQLHRNKVGTWDLHDNLYLSANFSGQTVFARFDGSYRHFSANIYNFSDQDTWTFQTGLGAILNLPCNFQFSTDFSVYNRRGFTDDALNTDNFVWNARLTYKVLKGSLLFMVDGYDMLKNLSNVSYTVNAQSRTEMIRTVLPSYFMFHIQWKFRKNPKSRTK